MFEQLCKPSLQNNESTQLLYKSIEIANYIETFASELNIRFGFIMDLGPNKKLQ
jgi:hypothetical protein